MLLRNGWPRTNGETGVGDSAGAGGAAGGATEKQSPAVPTTEPKVEVKAEPKVKPAVSIKRTGEALKPAARTGLLGELDKVRQETQTTRAQAEKTASELADERWDRALGDGKILPEYRAYVRSQLPPGLDPKSDAAKAEIDKFAEKHPAFKVQQAGPSDPVSEWVKAATPKDGKGLPPTTLRDIVSNLVR